MARRKIDAGLKVPSSSGGGVSQLLTLMALQNRSQAGQQEVPTGIPVGRTDPLTGVTFKTSEGQALENQADARKKAMTDAVTAIGTLRKITPIIDEFERDFVSVFPNAISQKGLPGKLQAGQVVFDARTLNNNPELAAAIDALEGKRSQITKGLGEVGNLAEQEQKIAMQNVPELKFGGLGDLFLPEAPAVGLSKLRRFRDFVNTQVQSNLEIIKSGGALENLPSNNLQSPIPGLGSNANTGFSTGQYRIGQEITSGGKKYRIIDISNPSDPEVEEILQ